MKIIYIVLGSLMLASCAHKAKAVNGRAFCPPIGVITFNSDPKIEGSWVELEMEGKKIKLSTCLAIFYDKQQ